MTRPGLGRPAPSRRPTSASCTRSRRRVGPAAGAGGSTDARCLRRQAARRATALGSFGRRGRPTLDPMRCGRRIGAIRRSPSVAREAGAARASYSGRGARDSCTVEDAFRKRRAAIADRRAGAGQHLLDAAVEAAALRELGAAAALAAEALHELLRAGRRRRGRRPRRARRRWRRRRASLEQDGRVPRPLDDAGRDLLQPARVPARRAPRPRTHVTDRLGPQPPARRPRGRRAAPAGPSTGAA